MTKRTVAPKKEEFLIEDYEVDDPELLPRVYIPKEPLIRIHPDIKRVSKPVHVMLIDHEWYLLSRDVMAEKIFKRGVWKARLYQGVTLEGESFVLPVTCPAGDGYEGWYDSMTKIIPLARNNWLRLRANKEERRWVCRIDREESALPQWPVWSLNELIHRAFAGRIIKRDHPKAKAMRKAAANSAQEVVEEE
jgi:hypothetical protein